MGKRVVKSSLSSFAIRLGNRLVLLVRLRQTCEAVHSKTSYSNATPSGSFCSSHVSAASSLAILVANLLSAVDVTQTVIGPSRSRAL